MTTHKGCTCTQFDKSSTVHSLAESYLTPEELVVALKGAVTTGTLRNHRHQRKGVRYIVVGRSILYPVSAVNEYLAAQTEAAERHWNDRN